MVGLNRTTYIKKNEMLVVTEIISVIRLSN